MLKLIVHSLVAEGRLDVLAQWVLSKDAPAQTPFTAAPNTDLDMCRGRVIFFYIAGAVILEKGPFATREIRTDLSLDGSTESWLYASSTRPGIELAV